MLFESNGVCVCVYINIYNYFSPQGSKPPLAQTLQDIGGEVLVRKAANLDRAFSVCYLGRVYEVSASC